MNLKLTLADGWQRLHRCGTVIAGSLFALVSAFGPNIVDAWNLLPQDLKELLPQGAARFVAAAAFLSLVLIRYMAVRPRDGEPK